MSTASNSRGSSSVFVRAWLIGAFVCAASASLSVPARAQRAVYEVNDVHFHLTNYIQEGTDIHRFLEIMGDKVGRVALFGIPLQQTWSYENSGDFNPTYYLQTDAPLYYYSFTDAYIAMAYRSLTPRERARFDPMITGFNPADMYAADHIRRVLTTFPGVFSGIGEFTIHKEFVSSKVAGDVASLTDPALDRILDFAAETGLVCLIHSDIDVPFAKEGAEPVYLTQMKALLRRHPKTTIIWAHGGLGRVIHPVRASAGTPPALARLRRRVAAPSPRSRTFASARWRDCSIRIFATPLPARRTPYGSSLPLGILPATNAPATWSSLSASESSAPAALAGHASPAPRGR